MEISVPRIDRRQPDTEFKAMQIAGYGKSFVNLDALKKRLGEGSF